MQIDAWYKIWCEECQAVNWVCDGDTSDWTQPDLEGFVCHKCGRIHHFDDMTTQSNDPQDYETGLEQPT